MESCVLEQKVMGSLEVKGKKIVVYVCVHVCDRKIKTPLFGFHWWSGAKWNTIPCYLALGPTLSLHTSLLHAPINQSNDTLINLTKFMFSCDPFAHKLIIK